MRKSNKNPKSFKDEIINFLKLKFPEERYSFLISFFSIIYDSFFNNPELKQGLFEFIDHLKNKDYLEDSYTSFDNKIGFNIEKELNKKVVLNFPYKDCTLEGGATKDDKTKTNEIFFNEILAKDELKRLREPKVLTNQKRFNANNNDKNSLSLQE